MSTSCSRRSPDTDYVIPGWSEGPDRRCAIAHRGISRFRVRRCATPRNDGPTQRLRPPLQQPQPAAFVPYLLTVADAIDRTGPVIGNEYRTVLGKHDVGGTAEITRSTL